LGGGLRVENERMQGEGWVAEGKGQIGKDKGMEEKIRRDGRREGRRQGGRKGGRARGWKG